MGRWSNTWNRGEAQERMARRCHCRNGKISEERPMEELNSRGQWVPSRVRIVEEVQHILCNGTGWLP